MVLKRYLILPHLQVRSANALASLYTVGFPAVTSFLGLGYALERQFKDLDVASTGIVVHWTEFQATRSKSNDPYFLSGKRPSYIKSKKGGALPSTNGKKPPYAKAMPDSFQPQGFVHLDVSLVLECKKDFDVEADDALREELLQAVYRLRLAGGMIKHLEQPKFSRCFDGDDRQVLRYLMPGYALLSRAPIMERLTEEGRGDSLDRLLYAMSSEAVASENTLDKDSKKTATYSFQRHLPGWLVPLPVGFHDLSGNLRVKGQRSYDYEHHFVEPVVTLCEFKMAHRLPSVDDMMWHYEYDESHKNYLCVNQPSI